MRKLVSLFSLTLLLQTFPNILQAQTPVNPIQQALDAGLMSNYPDGQFHPERKVMRAELAAIVVKTFQLEKRDTQQNPPVAITDVPPSHWAYNDIAIVLETGIMSGYRDGMFYPDRPVTRAEGFAIFAQAFGVLLFDEADVSSILSQYPDAAEIPDWARQAMATALFEGLVNVRPNNSLSPLEPMTRADIAYSLSRYLAKQENPGTIPDLPM
ncbi:S-layer homology domain-containing protein [Phormidium sp. CCY1219]|uniref:S-layer homology domain-containing protein n=1 Tax=Phormidium sp. CCY1219 TaxID=2886104 RepID=UPI002D1F0B5C|nr:S-layer homology domain-containing protein [Phormidium sp. CCY1219]MEB3830969.1 S-layer homology domain-containing protein [Phormidium sp. CCY1219]